MILTMKAIVARVVRVFLYATVAQTFLSLVFLDPATTTTITEAPSTSAGNLSAPAIRFGKFFHVIFPYHHLKNLFKTLCDAQTERLWLSYQLSEYQPNDGLPYHYDVTGIRQVVFSGPEDNQLFYTAFVCDVLELANEANISCSRQLRSDTSCRPKSQCQYYSAFTEGDACDHDCIEVLWYAAGSLPVHYLNFADFPHFIEGAVCTDGVWDNSTAVESVPPQEPAPPSSGDGGNNSNNGTSDGTVISSGGGSAGGDELNVWIPLALGVAAAVAFVTITAYVICRGVRLRKRGNADAVAEGGLVNGNQSGVAVAMEEHGTVTDDYATIPPDDVIENGGLDDASCDVDSGGYSVLDGVAQSGIIHRQPGGESVGENNTSPCRNPGIENGSATLTEDGLDSCGYNVIDGNVTLGRQGDGDGCRGHNTRTRHDPLPTLPESQEELKEVKIPPVTEQSKSSPSPFSSSSPTHLAAPTTPSPTPTPAASATRRYSNTDQMPLPLVLGEDELEYLGLLQVHRKHPTFRDHKQLRLMRAPSGGQIVLADLHTDGTLEDKPSVAYRLVRLGGEFVGLVGLQDEPSEQAFARVYLDSSDPYSATSVSLQGSERAMFVNPRDNLSSRPGFDSRQDSERDEDVYPRSSSGQSESGSLCYGSFYGRVDLSGVSSPIPPRTWEDLNVLELDWPSTSCSDFSDVAWSDIEDDA